MARDVGGERRGHDVRAPRRVDLPPDRGDRSLRPVRELRVPARDERIRLGGVQRSEHPGGVAVREPLRADQVEGDLVPVARWRHRAGAVGPEVGDLLLPVGERPRHVVDLLNLRRIGGAAKRGRRARPELRAGPQVPRPPLPGERLERQHEAGRRRHPEPRADGHRSLVDGVRPVGACARDDALADPAPTLDRLPWTLAVRKLVEGGGAIGEQVGEHRGRCSRDGRVLVAPGRVSRIEHRHAQERERSGRPGRVRAVRRDLGKLGLEPPGDRRTARLGGRAGCRLARKDDCAGGDEQSDQEPPRGCLPSRAVRACHARHSPRRRDRFPRAAMRNG